MISNNNNNNNFKRNEFVAPTWLNNIEFLTKVLQENTKDGKIVVKNVYFSPATLKGDHHASIILRAKVDFEQAGQLKTKSIIIKTITELEAHKKKLLDESFAFETEIGMYSKVLPKFEEILRAAGDTTKLGVNCIYHSLSPNKLIILEDLVPQGYSVLYDRPINLTELKLAYSKIAKIHAISHKLALENPTYFDEYRHSFMASPKILEDAFITGGIKLFIELLDSLPSLRKYKSYFVTAEPTLIQKCFDTYTEYRSNPQPNVFYVLSHGDFHLKNMMFKHDKQLDVKLFDYQLSFMGTAAIDLIYSYFLLLVDVQVRLKYFDEALQYYWATVVETFKKIGFNGHVPTFDELKKECKRHKHFEILILSTFLPAWYAMAEKLEVEQLMSSTEMRRKIYYRKKFIEDLHLILENYEKQHFFQDF